MKNILCYGDSNTYGYNIITKKRLNHGERWTGILQSILGEGYNIIEEGLSHRTTVWEDPTEEFKNGKEYLIPCLESHSPLDLVIIMLGTNDLKSKFSLSASDIMFGMECLVKKVIDSKCGLEEGIPRILMISPAPLGQLTELKELFYKGKEKSKMLAQYYSKISDKYKIDFLDAAKVVVVSDLDGVHLDKENHRKLANKLSEMVKEICI